MGSGPSSFYLVQNCMKVTGVCCKRIRRNLSSEAAGSFQKIGILGVPTCHGQRKAGVEDGPTQMRQAGLKEKLKALGHDVVDYGDVKFDVIPSNKDGNVINNLCCGAECKKVAEMVRNMLLEKRKCVILGGDHSLAIGSVFAHASVYPDMSLVWVDAHGDINTPKTSPSGNMHGMPLSLLIEEMRPYVYKPEGFEWMQTCISKNYFGYIGLRDVDSYEKYLIKQLEILNFSMAEIDRLGMQEVATTLLDTINPRGNRSLHVSFDIDALDKLLVPCTGTPVQGGLTLREAAVFAEEVFKRGNLSVLELVEVNPHLGTKEEAERTVDNAVRIITHFFGSKRSGNLPLCIDYSMFPNFAAEEQQESRRRTVS